MGAYSPSQKIAIIMLAVGDDLAAELMRHLPQNEMIRVSRALQSIKQVDQETVDEIMEEFFHTLQQPTQLKGGPQAAQRLLSMSFGQDMATQMGLEAEASLPILEDIEATQLSRFLQNESPQTIALVMAHLPPQKFRDTLKDLPATLHTEIILRMAKLEAVDASVLIDLNSALEEKLAKAGEAGWQTKVGGPEKVAKLLNALDSEKGRDLLSQLTERDPQLSEAIRSHLFTYEDLQNISAEGMQKLIGQIEKKDLTLAFKLTPDRLKEVFLSNMSERAGTMLLDDVESLGKIPRQDVIDAQNRIVAIAQALKEKGEISFADDEEYV